MDYYKIICWSECPFCLKAKNLLIDKGLQFEYCSVDHSRKLLEYYKKIYKTLSVVFELVGVCAIDRGLQFLRNWFKNKVPHHPATHM